MEALRTRHVEPNEVTDVMVVRQYGGRREKGRSTKAMDEDCRGEDGPINERINLTMPQVMLSQEYCI